MFLQENSIKAMLWDLPNTKHVHLVSNKRQTKSLHGLKFFGLAFIEEERPTVIFKGQIQIKGIMYTFIHKLSQFLSKFGKEPKNPTCKMKFSL